MAVRNGFLAGLVVVLAGMLAAPVSAADPAVVDREQYETAVAKAIQYLRTTGQAEDGSFSKQAGPAVTALVLTSLMQHGVSPDEPGIAKGLKYLEGFIQEDGGVYAPKTFYANYETCLAILCFAEAGKKDGRYADAIKKADAYIKGKQWGGDGKLAKNEFAFGGAGYGRSERPDLSNTSFLIDALKAGGNADDSEAIQAALLFVSRCQNLESEHNTTPFAAKNPDGGFYYTPAAGGSSQAGKTDDGGLRSYASMTYAGLKSMIYAGVKPDDPRVKAAVEWIRKHYDLESNPGMGDAGLYYYYHTFAKALSAMGQETFADEAGVMHNWRAELVAELASRQRADGAWVNENTKWLEGDANLTTGYALLALNFCKP